MLSGVVDIPLIVDTVAGASKCAPPLGGHFYAGPENCLAEVAVRSLLGSPVATYNPLVFYGPSGTGKSHLALGLAHAWKATASRRASEGKHLQAHVVSITAVDFARDLGEAIETQAVEEFRAHHRGASLWVLEDLGQLASRRSGKLSAQEELIHTLDALVEADRWAVVTCLALPADLPGIVPALKSRLMSGLVVPMSPPGPEARLAIIQQLAAAQKIPIPEPVARILADGLDGTVRELSGALLELMAAAQSGKWSAERGEETVEDGEDGSKSGDRRIRGGDQKRSTLHASFSPIDCPLSPVIARRYVAERNRGRGPSLHEIALATAKHFSLRLADLRSPVRRRALVAARGVAVYLARHHAGATLEDIGRYFGSRHHTTIIHSCHKTEKLVKSDVTIREAVERLHRTLWKT
jgi:chromosomal replication initiator protein